MEPKKNDPNGGGAACVEDKGACVFVDEGAVLEPAEAVVVASFEGPKANVEVFAGAVVLGISGSVVVAAVGKA